MSFQSINTANVKYKNGIMYITGNTRITQQNVYLTSGNFSKGAPIVNPNHMISSTPAPTGLPGISYTGVVSTPVPNYLIGNAFDITTYTFSVTNGTGDTLYTNGTYTVSASSVTTGFGHQIINLFNGINGGGYQEWQSAGLYTGATVSNCTTYAGTTSTLVNGTTYLGEWCQIKLPYSISITSFKYFTFNATYGRMVLVGSIDGSNWAVIKAEESNINNGGAPAGNGVYTTISTTLPYFSYVRLIALVGQNQCANPCNLILKGNINIGNTTPGYIATATYGTIGGTSVTINLNGTYTSFNVVRTNITAGNTIITYYGLIGTSYTDTTASPSTNYSYSIVPVNYSLNGTTYSVGSTRTMIAAPTLFAWSTRDNYSITFTFTPSPGSNIVYTASTSTGSTGSSTSSPITIYNLVKNTTYTATITATDSFGTSSPSNSTTISTTNSIPATATGAALVSRTSTSAIISFNSSLNAQTYIPKVGTVLFPSVTYSPATVNGLTPTTTYTAVIIASNDVGNAANSSNVTIYTKPNPPTNLQSSTDPYGATFAIITFTIPTGTITNYTATLDNGTIVTTTTSPVLFSGLLPNTTYSVTIVANASISNYGSSVPSDPLSFTISNTYIYYGTLSNLYGWTKFGVTISSNTFSLTAGGYSYYCYTNVGISLLGKTIQFDCKTAANLWFLFGCNSSGVGNYLSVGNGSYLGLAGSNTWRSFNSTIQLYSGSNSNTFNTYKIVISNTGTVTLYVNTVLKTIVSGAYTAVDTGNWIGFNGGTLNSGVYSYVSNLTIA